jgi:O-antigen/teichoic acid export membrane protein
MRTAKFTGLATRLRGPGRIAETVRNFSWLMGERFVGLTSSLLVTIPVARYLGPSDFGTLNFVIAIAALLAPFASVGLNHIVTKTLNDNPADSGRILGTVAIVRTGGTLLALGGVIIWLAVSATMSSILSVYICVMVAANLIGGLNFLQYWFLSVGSLGSFTRAQVANTILFSITKVLLVLLGMPLAWFVAISALEIAGVGALAYISYLLHPRSKGVDWQWNRRTASALVSKSWTLMASGITAAVYLKLDLIMLAHISGPKETGIYSAAAKISEIWYFVPVMLMTAMFPAILALKSETPERYNRKTQDILDILSAAGFAVASAVTLAAGPLVWALFGTAYQGAASMLSVHIWAGVFIFMRAFLSKWFIVEEMYWFSLGTTALGALTNVLLNLILIPKYGGMGASVATLISYAGASYFALLMHRRTWPLFWMMTKALFWPRRVPDVLRSVRRNAPGVDDKQQAD